MRPEIILPFQVAGGGGGGGKAARASSLAG